MTDKVELTLTNQKILTCYHCKKECHGILGLRHHIKNTHLNQKGDFEMRNNGNYNNQGNEQWRQNLKNQMPQNPNQIEFTAKTTPTETKIEKFIRIQEGRVESVYDAIKILEQGFNPNNYDYTPEMAEVILRGIERRVADLRHFAIKGTKNKKKFSIMDELIEYKKTLTE